MKCKVFTMLCLTMMAASLHAQTISRKLVDEENQPLQYANVVLLSLPDSAFVSGPRHRKIYRFILHLERKFAYLSRLTINM